MDGLVAVNSVSVPRGLLQDAKPRHGVLLAAWDSAAQLGRVTCLGVLRRVSQDFASALID
jgi:hypothetical protein